ncbi:hypothetical protein ASG35_03080 [Burkholderia sp. Leaf177]|nr:hypothetical protein ASG35_03080 [Burkholderia sp. Leaf177]
MFSRAGNADDGAKDVVTKTTCELKDVKPLIDACRREGQTTCTSGFIIRGVCGLFLSQVGVPASTAYTAKIGRFVMKNRSALGLTHSSARREKADNDRWTTVQEYVLDAAVQQ